jgi:hypothetical protein
MKLSFTDTTRRWRWRGREGGGGWSLTTKQRRRERKSREAKRTRWPNRRTKTTSHCIALFFGITPRDCCSSNSWFYDSLQSTPLTKDSVPESASIHSLTHIQYNELNSYTLIDEVINEWIQFLQGRETQHNDDKGETKKEEKKKKKMRERKRRKKNDRKKKGEREKKEK